jgi:hypothetical protein
MLLLFVLGAGGLDGLKKLLEILAYRLVALELLLMYWLLHCWLPLVVTVCFGGVGFGVYP